MNDIAVSVALACAAPATEAAASRLFPGAQVCVLTRDELRPSLPFRGPLFELLAEQPGGACVGLVVPASVVDGPRHPLLAVSDHVNLALVSPLAGRWPDDVRRTFPALTAIYQPSVVRARAGAPIYSAGVVVAGVGDARRLTPFESGAVREGGYAAVSDTLVPAAIIAAYYGLTLAACGVPQVDDRDEE